jgi:hypothetical protein
MFKGKKWKRKRKNKKRGKLVKGKNKDEKKDVI